MTQFTQIHTDWRDLPSADLESTSGSIYQASRPMFEHSIGAHRSRLFKYVRRFRVSYETAEDIVQETLVRAYEALRSGKYRHVNEAAFAAWLRTIALRQMFRTIDPREPRQASEPLTFERPAEIDSTGELMELGPGPARLTEQVDLLAFLNAQLDELLIHSQTGRKDKDMGQVKKRTFIRFYIDGLSQKEILRNALDDARRLNIATEVTHATINNWISRGDILRSLIHQLVRKHPTMMDKLSQIWTRSPDLNDEEREVLRMEWGLSMFPHEIAVFTQSNSVIVAARLASAKAKVANMLFNMVKHELHQSRSTKKSTLCHYR
jgi:DNA-directed RNA polymerase specialized sigma24 family protein